MPAGAGVPTAPLGGPDACAADVIALPFPVVPVRRRAVSLSPKHFPWLAILH
jgi:hypothetical protein